MYKVVKYFTDLQDNGHAYNVGDTFPHKGKIVSEARYAELAGSNNKQGRPLIELVEEKAEAKPKTKAKAEVAEEQPAEVEAEVKAESKPKRGRKKS